MLLRFVSRNAKPRDYHNVFRYDRHMAVVQTHTVRVYLHYTRIMDYKSSNTSRNLNKNPFSRCLVFLSAAVPFDGRHRPELAGPSGWRGQPALRS